MTDAILVGTGAEDLVSRRHIEALLHRSARLLDDHDYEGWTELFTEDGEYKAISAENHRLGLPLGIIDDDRLRMRDRQEMIEKYWSLEPTQTRHLITNIDIRLDEPDRAHVDAYFVVFVVMPKGLAEIQGLGRYEDELAFDGDAWRFRRRLAIFDNHLIAHAISLPF